MKTIKLASGKLSHYKRRAIHILLILLIYYTPLSTGHVDSLDLIGGVLVFYIKQITNPKYIQMSNTTEEHLLELYNENAVLTNKLKVREDLIERLKEVAELQKQRVQVLKDGIQMQEKINKLQQNTVEKLQAKAFNLQNRVNLLEQQRWANRKLEEDRPGIVILADCSNL